MSGPSFRCMPLAGVCLAVHLCIACDSPAPAAPTARAPVAAAPAAPAPGPPTVLAVSPAAGSVTGATPVLISGTGFRSGAAVILGGAASKVTVVSETEITATTAAHGAGVVDVVVTNPDGQAGRLGRAFTFAPVTPGPAPRISSVSPTVGTTEAGGTIAVRGTGFQEGSIIRLDEAVLRTHYQPGASILRAQAPAHAPGTVDVFVINPDGQIATLAGAYKYAAAGTLDFTGTWHGIGDDGRDDHASAVVRLTVERNRVVSVSCNSQVTLLSPAPDITDGRFASSADGRLVVTGRFVSADEVRGTIDLPPCGPGWGALRQ